MAVRSIEIATYPATTAELHAELDIVIAETPEGDVRGVVRKLYERYLPLNGAPGAPRKYQHLLDEARALAQRGMPIKNAARLVAEHHGGDNAANIARRLTAYLSQR
jgi:hypothetical protein